MYMEHVEIALQNNDFPQAKTLMMELLKIAKDVKESSHRQETRSGIDSLRTLMNDQVIRRIQYTGEKRLIQFARTELKIEDVVTPFLQFQQTRLHQMLVKVQPIDQEAAKLNPIRTAGIVSDKQTSIQQ